jgi:hypothetical protein
MNVAEPKGEIVYTSPRGKRCVLVTHGRAMGWLEFRYLDDTTLAGGGFCLSRENFRLMKEAAYQRFPARASGPRVLQ